MREDDGKQLNYYMNSLTNMLKFIFLTTVFLVVLFNLLVTNKLFFKIYLDVHSFLTREYLVISLVHIIKL